MPRVSSATVSVCTLVLQLASCYSISLFNDISVFVSFKINGHRICHDGKGVSIFCLVLLIKQINYVLFSEKQSSNCSFSIGFI